MELWLHASLVNVKAIPDLMINLPKGTVICSSSKQKTKISHMWGNKTFKSSLSHSKN